MKYPWLTVKHKWFVLLAGLRVGVPIWRLLIHDWTKLMPSELPHYQRQFFGDANDPAGFIRCWLHHQNRHEHHWEYWIPRTGHNRCTPPYPDMQPIPMTEVAVREMVADWMGAGRAYTGAWPNVALWGWWQSNIDKIKPHLHRTTMRRLNSVLRHIGAWPHICDYQHAYNSGSCYRIENASGKCLRGYCPFGGGRVWIEGDKEAAE